MIPLKRRQLEEMALLRPAGYLERALALSFSEDDGLVIFTREAFATLKAEYGDFTPSLRQKAEGLAASLSRWASEGLPVTSPELLTSRRESCAGCKWFRPSRVPWLAGCRRCGCSGIKLHMATERCPLGKW